MVVTLGKFADQLLLETKEGITKLRGRGRTRSATACSSRRSTRPYVLRGGGEPMAQMRADLVRAKQALGRARRRVTYALRTNSVRRRPRRSAARCRAGPSRRPAAAGRRPRRRQDRVRAGLRRGARRRPSRSPARRSRSRAATTRAACRCTTSTCTGSSSSTEVLDLGLPEMLDEGGVTLIEWGDAIIAGAARRLPRGAARLRRRRRRPRRIALRAGRPALVGPQPRARPCAGRAGRHRRRGPRRADPRHRHRAPCRSACAIGGHEGVLASTQSARGKRHAEILTPTIEFVCRQARIELSRDQRASPSTSAPACSPACGSASPRPRPWPTRCACR